MTKNKPQSISWQANEAGMSLTKREKATTIEWRVRLTAKRHESTELVNLTCTEYLG